MKPKKIDLVAGRLGRSADAAHEGPDASTRAGHYGVGRLGIAREVPAEAGAASPDRRAPRAPEAEAPAPQVAGQLPAREDVLGYVSPPAFPTIPETEPRETPTVDWSVGTTKRRLVVLGMACVVSLLILLMVFRGGGEEGEGVPAEASGAGAPVVVTVPSPTPAATPQPVPPSPTPGPIARPTPEPTPVLAVAPTPAIVVPPAIAPTPASAPIVPTPSSTPEPPKYRECPAGIRLSGVIHTPTGAFANINGRMLKIGSVVDGAKLIEIRDFSVEMELQGERFIVGIGADDSAAPSDEEEPDAEKKEASDDVPADKTSKPTREKDKPAPRKIAPSTEE